MNLNRTNILMNYSLILVTRCDGVLGTKLVNNNVTLNYGPRRQGLMPYYNTKMCDIGLRLISRFMDR